VAQTKPKEVEMESITQEGLVFDFGSLFGRFQGLSDKRKRRGLRYSLVLILMIILLAKTCGENHPSGEQPAQRLSGLALSRTGLQTGTALCFPQDRRNSRTDRIWFYQPEPG
jgi:hypothetical protein